MMRSSAVFCLAVSFAMFGFGFSLQCYSCTDGSSGSCEVKRQCIQPEDSCIKLTSGEMTYTDCVSYTDCNFRTLAVRYSLPEFTYSCCQSDLCNKRKKSLFEKVKNYFS